MAAYYIESLLLDDYYRWNYGDPVGSPVTVTYSFMAGVPSYYADYGEYVYGFEAFNDEQKAAARTILAEISAVCNITFVEVSDSGSGGDIRFGTNYQSDSAAYAYYPMFDLGGDVWLNNLESTNDDMTRGNYGFLTLLHEIGHALGLQHSFEEVPVLPASEENRRYTVMSYTDAADSIVVDVTGNSSSYSYEYYNLEPDTLMLYDIAALQYLYGASSAGGAGDTLYTFTDNRFFKTIWDASGNDTIDVSNFSRSSVIDLREGAFSSIGVYASASDQLPDWYSGWALPTFDGSDILAIAYGAVIENATGGTASDILTGNDVANSLVGNGGNDSLVGNGGADVLDGGAGADTMVGGDGDDTYFVDNAGDVLTELTGAGIDTVRSWLSLTLGSNLENLTLLGNGILNGSGNELANVLLGNGAANSLYGAGGADTLDGGAGADTLVGGAGDDTYLVDSAGDLVSELNLEGTDTVRSWISYTLGANVENLLLRGSDAINATGNELANYLTGNGAANWLDGGVGADAMAGGGGDDTYFVDNVGDTVSEAATQGTDTVRAWVSFTLGANVENLLLRGTGAIDGTGNALVNILTGNDAANRLDGMAGADTLIGGGGDDTYFVDNIGDVVRETADQGYDTIRSWVSLTMSDNIEALILRGTDLLYGIGNALNNSVAGNESDNVLRGASGDDVLTGAGGKDKLYGERGNDRLDGGEGNDRLEGGAGADTLTGGAGSDSFAYLTASQGGDYIADFRRLDGDKITFDGTAFGGLAAGKLDIQNFIVSAGAIAGDADDFFIFNTQNRSLYFDQDGNGSAAAVKIATFAKGVELRNTDILIG